MYGDSTFHAIGDIQPLGSSFEGSFRLMASALLRPRVPVAHRSRRGRRQATPDVARAGWFHLLTPEAQAQVQQSVAVRALNTGEPLLQPGAAVRAWYGVLHGFLAVEPATQGAGQTMAGVPEGGWFGEGYLLCRDASDCTVVACVPSVVAAVPAATFEALLDQEPAFSRFVLQAEAQRLQALRQRTACQRRLGTNARVACALADMFAAPVLFEGNFRLELTQTALSRFLGLSRQRTNAALNELERQGEIEIEYGGVRVKEPRRLMRRALAGDIR